MNQFHEAVEMGGALIDVRMGPVIKALWDIGVATKYCCEGGIMPHSGVYQQGYIMFADGEDRIPWLFQHLTQSFPRLGSQMYLEYNAHGENDCWTIRFDPECRAAIQRAAEYPPEGFEEAA